MRTIQIGKLNKRLKFNKLTDSVDSMGQSKKQLAEICEVWGSLYPIRGNEFYELQKIQSKITHKAYIRYRAEIDSNCFIQYEDKIYNIESVLDVDLEHKMLEIMCSEHTNKEVVAYG